MPSHLSTLALAGFTACTCAPESPPDAPAPAPAAVPVPAPVPPPEPTFLELRHPHAFGSLFIDGLTMHPSDAAIVAWTQGRDERTAIWLEMDPCLPFPHGAPRGDEAPAYVHRVWKGVTWGVWAGFDAELLSIDLTVPDRPLVSLGPTSLSDASTPRDVVDAIAAFPPGPKAPPPDGIDLEAITSLWLHDDVRDGAVQFTFEDGRLTHIENWCDNT